MKRNIFVVIFSLIVTVLLIGVDFQHSRSIPCDQDVSYDCVARELFNSLPDKQDTYDLFNTNLRGVFYLFYDVNDDRLLRDVLAQFERIEQQGVLDVYDQKARRGIGHAEPSFKIEKSYLLIGLGEKDRAIEIVNKYSRDRDPVQREEIIIKFLIQSGEYDEGLDRLKKFFDAGYHGSDLTDAPAFKSQMLYELFYGFLARAEYSKAEQVVMLIDEYPDYDDWTMSADAAYIQMLTNKFDNKHINQKDICEDWKRVWISSASNGVSVEPFVKYNCFVDDYVAREIVRQSSIRRRNFYNLAALGEDAEIKKIISGRQQLSHKYHDNLDAAQAYFMLNDGDLAYQYLEAAKSLIPELFNQYKNENGRQAPECQAQLVGIVLRDWVSYQEGNEFIHKYSCANPNRGTSDLLVRKISSPEYFIPAYEERLRSGTTNPSLLRPFVELFSRNKMYDEAIHIVEYYQSNDINALHQARSHDYLTILINLLWVHAPSERDESLKKTLWRRYMANCMSFNSDFKGDVEHLNSDYFRRRSCYVDFLRSRQNSSRI